MRAKKDQKARKCANPCSNPRTLKKIFAKTELKLRLKKKPFGLVQTYINVYEHFQSTIDLQHVEAL